MQSAWETFLTHTRALKEKEKTKIIVSPAVRGKKSGALIVVNVDNVEDLLGERAPGEERHEDLKAWLATVLFIRCGRKHGRNLVLCKHAAKEAQAQGLDLRELLSVPAHRKSYFFALWRAVHELIVSVGGLEENGIEDEAKVRLDTGAASAIAEIGWDSRSAMVSKGIKTLFLLVFF